MRELKDIATEVMEIFENLEQMLPLTVEQQEEHENATICHMTVKMTVDHLTGVIRQHVKYMTIVT